VLGWSCLRLVCVTAAVIGRLIEGQEKDRDTTNEIDVERARRESRTIEVRILWF